MADERDALIDPAELDTGGAPGSGGAGLSGPQSAGADAGAGPGGPDGGWAAGGEEADGREAGVGGDDDRDLETDVAPGAMLTDPAEAGGDDQTPGMREGEPVARVDPTGGTDSPAVGRGMGDLTSRAPGDGEPHPEDPVDRAAATGPDLQPGAADEGA